MVIYLNQMREREREREDSNYLLLLLLLLFHYSMAGFSHLFFSFFFFFLSRYTFIWCFFCSTGIKTRAIMMIWFCFSFSLCVWYSRFYILCCCCCFRCLDCLIHTHTTIWTMKLNETFFPNISELLHWVIVYSFIVYWWRQNEFSLDKKNFYPIMKRSIFLRKKTEYS